MMRRSKIELKKLYEELFSRTKKKFLGKAAPWSDINIRDVMAVDADNHHPSYGEYFSSNFQMIVANKDLNEHEIHPLISATKPTYIFTRNNLYYKTNGAPLALIECNDQDYAQLKIKFKIDSSNQSDIIRRNLKISELKNIKKITSHQPESEHQKESENHIVARMSQHIAELANITKKIHYRDNFQGYAYLAISEKEPKLENMQANTLVALHEDGQLTIFWLENGKINNRSFSDNMVQSAIDRLPEPGNITEDLSLIRDIASQYDCLPGFAKGNDTSTISMKKDCENNITRLSFNEFSFFPSESQGPLTEKGLNELLIQVDTVASTMPENLHILIASVPVVNEINEMRNMIFYVQCGKNPIINAFAKAIPSQIDFLYPGTTNPYVSTGSVGDSLIGSIQAFLSHDNGDNPDTIREFMQKCFCNPDYPPPSGLVIMLNEYINKLKKNPATDEGELQSQWLAILDNILEFKKTIEAKSEDYYNITIANQLNIPGIKLNNNKTNTAGYEYGGYVQAKTAGGNHFTINVDICLDHNYGIAKIAFNRNLTLRNDTVEPGNVPTHTSPIVTSATVGIRPENVIGNPVTHTDIVAARTGIRYKEKDNPEDPESNHTVTETSFGNSVNIIINKPITLSKLSGNEAIRVAEHNRLSIKVQTLNHLVAQQPRLNDHASIELVHVLADEAVNRSQLWLYASPTEKAHVLNIITNDLMIMKDSLFENPRLGIVVDTMVNKIEAYFIEKKTLLTDLRNYLSLANTKNSVHVFFQTIMDPEEDMRIVAAYALLDYLIQGREIKLTKPQLTALLDKDSPIGASIFSFFNKNIDHLLPTIITDFYQATQKNTQPVPKK